MFENVFIEVIDVLKQSISYILQNRKDKTNIVENFRIFLISCDHFDENLYGPSGKGIRRSYSGHLTRTKYGTIERLSGAHDLFNSENRKIR